MNRPIKNTDIKNIISIISSYIEDFESYNRIDLIYEFIDSKDFNKRENKFISINIYSKNINYLLLIEDNNNDLQYALTLQKSEELKNKIFFNYTDKGFNLSLNNFYWENENSISFNEAFYILFNKNDLLNFYVLQKDIIVPFQYFVDNIDSYKKINKITQY